MSQQPCAPEVGEEAIGAWELPSPGYAGGASPGGKHRGLWMWEGKGVISVQLGFGRLLLSAGKTQAFEK